MPASDGEATPYSLGPEKGRPAPSPAEDYPSDVIESLGELSHLLISEEDVTSTINKIAQTALQCIDACECSGISLVMKFKKVKSVGATDPLARGIDEMQHEIGEGPCLTSIEKHATFRIDDFREEKRWPRFSAEVAKKGIRSGASFVLEVSEESLAAMNLYSSIPGAFSDHDLELGTILASHAAVALSNAQTHQKSQELVRQLEESVQTRTVIGQAVGVLMAQGTMTRDQAFEALKRISQGMNVKLKKLAEQVVEESESKAAP